MRTVSGGEPGAAVVNSAPHVPAVGRSASRTYIPRSPSIVQTNAPSAVLTVLAGSLVEVVERDLDRPVRARS